ncbi:hypothetical protein H4R18_003692 [Coemansia javaensis]|uniref:Uncharacterized protein n=1 Tax=Coemansia javaensis TaxID=2761396 RepID=A0A9W8HCY3_9FUNG|nr:hypothetical protein H4R18_003692 [Coemansia javaensis]
MSAVESSKTETPTFMGPMHNRSVCDDVLDGSQPSGTRASWSTNDDHIFVSILARHSVCNERQGLVLNHMSVDAKIINDVAKGLGGGVDIDELVRQLAAKYPAKKKEHRSHACINLITEMKKKIPRYSYQQLNNKHINMWTRTIAPFRQMFDCGSPYKGKSPFHRDCKRFIKVLLEFLSNMIANGVTQVDLQVFARRADKGCKLLEQWLTAMLATHGVGMVNFLYACGVRVATAFINGKNLKDRSAEETRFLNTELHTPKEVHTVLRAYMDRIATCEALDAIPTQPIIVDVAEAARANSERCRELALAGSDVAYPELQHRYAAGMPWMGLLPPPQHQQQQHQQQHPDAVFGGFPRGAEYARAPPEFHPHSEYGYRGPAGPPAAAAAYQRLAADHWARPSGAEYMPPPHMYHQRQQSPGGRMPAGYMRAAPPLYHPYYGRQPPMPPRAYHEQAPEAFGGHAEAAHPRLDDSARPQPVGPIRPRLDEAARARLDKIVRARLDEAARVRLEESARARLAGSAA